MTSISPHATAPIDAPLGILDGRRYLDSLDDGRNVWLNGERIDDVARHSAFSAAAQEFARQLDLQHDPEHAADMTAVDEQSGLRIARAYSPPRTAEDLRALRRNAERWFRESWGQHGRSPAFMATIAVGLLDFRNRLATNAPEHGRNAAAWHRYVATRDLLLTHALGDPQIDRSSTIHDDEDLALRIVRRNGDGSLVVRGAKQLTTLAPIAHEVLVYLSASFALRGAEDYVVWFALPLNAPGLHILCREPFGATVEGHRHPFAQRFDEQDAMLFFDDVEIPADRVFLTEDGALALEGLSRINAWSQYVGQLRYRERLRTLLAVGSLTAEAIGVDGQANVQADLGELASYVEILGHFVDAGEATARRTDGGLLAPGPTPAAAIWAAEVAGRAIDIVREIGKSGTLMQPTEGDLSNPALRDYLERWMRGREITVDEKARLFRLAWDLTSDSFGQRQHLYEFAHRGDLNRNRVNLYRRHDGDATRARVRELIAAPL